VRKWVLPALVVALLAPLLRTEYPGSWGAHIGPPVIFGADEEAYLLLVNSVIRDGDLDLKNNHGEVMLGAREAGGKNAGRILDHHSTYYVNGERKVWRDLVDPRVYLWPRDARGVPQFVFKPGLDPALAAGPEYSAHPVGVALLLAPLMWPFANTDLVEPMTLLWSGLATVAALFCLRSILRQMGGTEGAIQLTLVAAFLGTPLWYYGRAFFNESFVTLAVLGAYAVILRPRGALAAGAIVAAGMLMKPQLALLCLPLAIPALRQRSWRGLLALGVFPVAALGLLLWLNHHMYGSITRGPYPFSWGNPLEALWGEMVQKEKGLLWFAPAVLFAVLGWPALWREKREYSAMILGGFALFFGLVMCWVDWGGGWCYGPRLVAPVLPLLAVGLVRALELPLMQKAAMKWAFRVVLVWACVVNGFAATTYWYAWHRFPTEFIALSLGLKH